MSLHIIRGETLKDQACQQPRALAPLHGVDLVDVEREDRRSQCHARELTHALISVRPIQDGQYQGEARLTASVAHQGRPVVVCTDSSTVCTAPTIAIGSCTGSTACQSMDSISLWHISKLRSMEERTRKTATGQKRVQASSVHVPSACEAAAFTKRRPHRQNRKLGGQKRLANAQPTGSSGSHWGSCERPRGAPGPGRPHAHHRLHDADCAARDYARY